MPDILIRGFEVPKKDSIIIAIRPDGMIEDIMGCYIGKATELPEHGDLIDRDALPQDRVEWEDVVNAPVIVPSNKEGSE